MSVSLLAHLMTDGNNVFKWNQRTPKLIHLPLHLIYLPDVFLHPVSALVFWFVLFWVAEKG